MKVKEIQDHDFKVLEERLVSKDIQINLLERELAYRTRESEEKIMDL